jgi:hypothetical protein
MAERSGRGVLDPRGLLMQWTGVLAGPVVWAVHMQTNLSLVPWVCKNGGLMLLHVVTILALLITAVGAFAAWRALQEGREEDEAGGGVISRSRFMGALGLLMSAMFFLVIIAQAVPSFFFQPCQR